MAGLPKILAVDDTEVNLVVLKKVLKSVDAEIITASSGNEALSLLLQHEFSLVLLDVQMPGMNGYEVAEIMQSDESQKHTPIIFVTAINQEDAQVYQGYASGAVDYIFKPLKKDILLSKVNVFLRLYRQKKKLDAALEEKQIAYKQLADNQAQLIQAKHMASVGQLAGGVAHEINNPLGFISSNMSILKEYFEQLSDVTGAVGKAIASGVDLPSNIIELYNKSEYDYIMDDSRELLSEAESGLSRVKAIVENLYTFASLEQTEYAQVDVLELITNAINILPEEMIKLVVVVPPSEGLPNLLCDQGKINQVIMNIVKNACQSYKGSNIDEITITPKVSGNSLMIIVEDKGCGIKDTSHIFDPFFTTRDIGEGVGLGLTFCYNIVSEHGGTIEVESSPNSGSIFTLKFPITEG